MDHDQCPAHSRIDRSTPGTDHRPGLMDYDACRELHNELVYRLKRELVFYRSLFVLIERQRDAVERGVESELALWYGELNTIAGGLRESQFAISTMRQKEPELFERASRLDPVPEMVQQAAEILAAAHRSLQEGTWAARRHYRKLKAELTRLGEENEALRANRPRPRSGHIPDGTR